MILHVITGLSTGGAEGALCKLLRGGVSDSSKHGVLSLGGEGTYGPQIRSLGIPVYTLNMRRGLPGPSSVSRLRRIVRVVRPQVLQGWMYHGNLAATLASWMVPGGRPAVVWNVRHSLYALADEKPLTRQVVRFNRWVSASPDAIVYNSQLSRSQHEAFGFSAVNGQVIPNGFDMKANCPDPKRGVVSRRDVGMPEDAIVIGHVARFHPMKDHASFLRAAVQVMRQLPDVVCLLAGRNVNLSNPALAGIVPPELEGRFRFVGERDDVPDLMRVMDVFCQSSWSEAFPNVLGEAMASGVPCVATDVGDSALIVGDTGEMVPPKNGDALFDGLMAILKKNSLEREALGRAARRRIEANFSLGAVVDQYSRLYQSLLLEKGEL